jgi:hypothetical protein
MGNKPSRVRLREIQQVIRGARKEGAKKVEIRIGKEASVIIPRKTSRSLLRTRKKSPSNALHAAPSTALLAAGSHSHR